MSPVVGEQGQRKSDPLHHQVAPVVPVGLVPSLSPLSSFHSNQLSHMK